MEEYILISTLNDFIFCPYSIYLHNVYMGADESTYYAEPQIKGRIAHETIDNHTYSTRSNIITSLAVYSERFHLMGKVDIYKQDERKLIERKNNLKQIYQGQIYQLWAQYFCMKEMGYQVEKLAFYEMSTNTTFPISLPNEEEEQDFSIFIEKFHNYRPDQPIPLNINKCRHCVYCNLCDKTECENVYT